MFSSELLDAGTLPATGRSMGRPEPHQDGPVRRCKRRDQDVLAGGDVDDGDVGEVVAAGRRGRGRWRWRWRWRRLGWRWRWRRLGGRWRWRRLGWRWRWRRLGGRWRRFGGRWWRFGGRWWRRFGGGSVAAVRGSVVAVRRMPRAVAVGEARGCRPAPGQDRAALPVRRSWGPPAVVQRSPAAPAVCSPAVRRMPRAVAVGEARGCRPGPARDQAAAPVRRRERRWRFVRLRSRRCCRRPRSARRCSAR